MEQTLAPRLDDRLYNMIFQDRSPSAARRFVTGSQRAAVPKLRQLHQVGMMKQSFAGIAPRTKPLLVGASGCGKSATVRLLAQELGVETLTVNAGSWIVYGAKNDNYTIQQIRDFVCRQWQRGGLIFIDELDKCVPHDTARMDSWSQSVFTELLAVLDADKRLLAMGWNEDMLGRCRVLFFLQRQQVELVVDEQRKGVGDAAADDETFAQAGFGFELGQQVGFW